MTKRRLTWGRCLVAALIACGAMPVVAQSWPFPWPEDRIAEYTARRASSPIVVDGLLDEADWRAAVRSPRFADLIGGQPGIHDTRAAVLWDDTYLYVGYWVEEPFVEATLTERDSLIYKNNDVELFIAGRDAYYEFEINAFGTIYEVFFIWEQAFESSGYARMPEFDRTREGVRPFGGVRFDKHPRGPRIGYWNWDMPGLATAVHVDGTINDNRDRDRDGPSRCAFRGARSRPWPCPTGGRCRRATATCGVWTSRASTSTRRPLRPRTPAAGPGARTAYGTPTCRSCSRACDSPPRPLAARRSRPEPRSVALQWSEVDGIVSTDA